MLELNHFPNYLEISRDALVHNAKAIAEYVGTKVIGVLKCEGYGVSIPEAARSWQQAGVTMFAVSTPTEAVTLRQEGFQEEILLLSPVADVDTLGILAENSIILTVTDLENAQFYSSYDGGAPLRVHVAVDTGMGRFGVRWTDPQQLMAIYEVPGLCFEGIFSHFAASFEKEFNQTKTQLDRFLQVVDELQSAGYPVGMRHIANSCAALRFPETRLDAVRMGSALVGALNARVDLPLQRVGTLKAQVVARKTFLPGDTTGYASVCKIKHPTDAIVVAIGHECGFGVLWVPDRFSLRNLASYIYHTVMHYFRPPCVTYNGKQLPMIGRLGNQFTLFDATGVDIQPGEYVSARVNLLFPGRNRTFI